MKRIDKLQIYLCFDRIYYCCIDTFTLDYFASGDKFFIQLTNNMLDIYIWLVRASGHTW